MTNAEYLHWQGVLTDLAYMGMSVVAGMMGWWMSREVERMSGKRKRILAQRRAMQRRITNLRRLRSKDARAMRDYEGRIESAAQQNERLREILSHYNPTMEQDEILRMLHGSAVYPPSRLIITNLSLPKGL